MTRFNTIVQKFNDWAEIYLGVFTIEVRFAKITDDLKLHNVKKFIYNNTRYMNVNLMMSKKKKKMMTHNKCIIINNNV
jgi:hypothetical protein